MQLLYPQSLLNPKHPEENYQDEYSQAIKAGFVCSLFSFEDFLSGRLKMTPKISSSEPLLYRGWMLEPGQYSRLYSEIKNVGATMMTSHEQYELCHYLPRWYPLLAECTSETLFFRAKEDVIPGLRKNGWGSCFLKDYVKSLSTGIGAVAHTLEEIPEILNSMEKYRGKIEGGICARRLEKYLPDSEERVFVIKGTLVSRNVEMTAYLKNMVGKITSPFFTVDVARRADGELRIIELGDGQVSDLKQWEPTEFIKNLKAHMG